MRTFVAINLSADVRAAAWTAAAPLRDALGRAIAWTSIDALHVTLAFLGERSDAFVAALAARLVAPLAREAPVDVSIGGLGAFPSLRRPRVLWLGATNRAIARLYHIVADACDALGVPRESRPFHAHVTLGRVRREQHVDGAAIARLADAVRVRATDRIRSVDVMESVLGRGGARYRVVSAVPLGLASEGA